MLNKLKNSQRVYLVTGYTNLRCSIDGLVAIVQAQLKLDPYNFALFLFCVRRCDRIKGLFWEGDGFLLLYKRLDNNGTPHILTDKDKILTMFDNKKSENSIS